MRGAPRRLLLAVFCLVAGSACDKHNRAVVSGIVTLDGNPVEAGTITFAPVDGRATTQGGKIADGKYSVVSALAR